MKKIIKTINYLDNHYAEILLTQIFILSMVALFISRSRLCCGLCGALFTFGAYLYINVLQKKEKQSAYVAVSHIIIFVLGMIGLFTMDSKWMNHELLLFLAPYTGSLWALILIGMCSGFIKSSKGE